MTDMIRDTWLCEYLHEGDCQHICTYAMKDIKSLKFQFRYQSTQLFLLPIGHSFTINSAKLVNFYINRQQQAHIRTQLIAYTLRYPPYVHLPNWPFCSKHHAFLIRLAANIHIESSYTPCTHVLHPYHMQLHAYQIQPFNKTHQLPWQISAH